MNEKLQAVIARLETEPKQGESYDQMGAHGWRNPIRADTGPILQALILAKRPQYILEIGTARGLSACHMAVTLPEHGRILTIEWDQESATIAQANFDEAQVPIKVNCGNALEVIEQIAAVSSVPFDMVFLDANKDGYLDQITALLKNGLLHVNCLIVADNVIDRQKECQNFLDYMAQFEPIILQTECGLLVATI